MDLYFLLVQQENETLALTISESNVAIGKNNPETIGKQNNVYENAFSTMYSHLLNGHARNGYDHNYNPVFLVLSHVLLENDNNLNEKIVKK